MHVKNGLLPFADSWSGSDGMAATDPALQPVDRCRRARAAQRASCASAAAAPRISTASALQGERLDVRPLAGISSYEPTELVVTARAGTPLAELEATLAERGQ